MNPINVKLVMCLLTKMKPQTSERGEEDLQGPGRWMCAGTQSCRSSPCSFCVWLVLLKLPLFAGMCTVL